MRSSDFWFFDYSFQTDPTRVKKITFYFILSLYPHWLLCFCLVSCIHSFIFKFLVLEKEFSWQKIYHSNILKWHSSNKFRFIFYYILFSCILDFQYQITKYCKYKIFIFIKCTINYSDFLVLAFFAITAALFCDSNIALAFLKAT